MKAASHLGIAAELLKTFALVDEPKLLLACVEEVRKALRAAGIRPELARTLDRILSKHRESPMEFSRSGKLIIADDRFLLETLDGAKIAAFIEEARREIGTHGRELLTGR